MGRGKKLNDIEKGQIKAFYESGQSMRWISKRIHRSLNVVEHFLADTEAYGKKSSPGRPRKLNSRTERRILAELTNSNKGVRHVRDNIVPEVSHQTVWRVAKKSPNIVHQHKKATPHLTIAHKQARIQFAEKHITWTHQWKTVSLGNS